MFRVCYAVCLCVFGALGILVAGMARVHNVWSSEMFAQYTHSDSTGNLCCCCCCTSQHTFGASERARVRPYKTSRARLQIKHAHSTVAHRVQPPSKNSAYVGAQFMYAMRAPLLHICRDAFIHTLLAWSQRRRQALQLMRWRVDLECFCSRGSVRSPRTARCCRQMQWAANLNSFIS